MASLIPVRIRRAPAGQAVKNPAIILACIRNQRTGLPGCRWCGAGHTWFVGAIQPNGPASNAVSESMPAPAASVEAFAQAQAAHRKPAG